VSLPPFTQLGSLEISSLEAEKESKKVAKIKSGCEAEAARITAEKNECEADLAKAQPFLDEANTAIESIKPAHINEVKKLPKPSDIIRLVFDGVLVLFMGRVDPPTVGELTMNKKTFEFLSPSWSFALTVMADTQFLKRIQEFEKDKMNEETIELLSPYMDLEDFNPKVAKAVRGLPLVCVCGGGGGAWAGSVAGWLGPGSRLFWAWLWGCGFV
jgi:dynein heavy chain